MSLRASISYLLIIAAAVFGIGAGIGFFAQCNPDILSPKGAHEVSFIVGLLFGSIGVLVWLWLDEKIREKNYWDSVWSLFVLCHSLKNNGDAIGNCDKLPELIDPIVPHSSSFAGDCVSEEPGPQKMFRKSAFHTARRCPFFLVEKFPFFHCRLIRNKLKRSGVGFSLTHNLKNDAQNCRNTRAYNCPSQSGFHKTSSRKRVVWCNHLTRRGRRLARARAFGTTGEKP